MKAELMIVRWDDNLVVKMALLKVYLLGEVMDELWDLGARGILVTDIHACRL